MQDLRQGNYIVMYEEYNRAGRVSDRHSVYICWNQEKERAPPRTGYRFNGSRSMYFHPDYSRVQPKSTPNPKSTQYHYRVNNEQCNCHPAGKTRAQLIVEYIPCFI